MREWKIGWVQLGLMAESRQGMNDRHNYLGLGFREWAAFRAAGDEAMDKRKETLFFHWKLLRTFQYPEP